jgi:hypothetical protein
MEFAREVGVTQRGVGVTLDRISALIKTKPGQEDSAPGESTEQKVQYNNRGLACLAEPGVSLKPALKTVNSAVLELRNRTSQAESEQENSS